ncbi:hypothetical protein C2S51_029155 [Perilla frutescens var. frutescens]|nr:hypothetical protein C2S51_029155 [Perilla frutescens var. frutescens]
MEYHRKWFRLLVFLIILLSQGSRAWWFSSNKQTHTHASHDDASSSIINHVGAEFALDSLDNDEKAINLVENAKLQMRASHSCWVNSYQNLFAGCTKIAADQDLKDKLTWDLSNCFMKHSGRAEFPYCDAKYPTRNCLKKLDDDAHKVFLQYFLQIDSICHQLQVHAFKHQTERLVNELKRSAEYAEDKLHNIEERGKTLLHNSKHIHGTLASIEEQTQQVAETSRNLQDNVNIVKTYSEEVYEQSKGIAASQGEMIEGQTKMRERINEGMAMLHESYDNLGTEILNLRDETVEIEREIGKVGEEMFSRMNTLHSKADDIENLTGTSLLNQKQLLEAQTTALQGLRILTTFQSQALEESRGTLQELSEFGKKQQEELLHRQEELQRANNQLAQNSKTILAAQEAFESKQARMLNALDKLFALHNAMLIESRSIKTFIIYSLLMFVLYMFTSMKQTYNVRPRLYLGLCAAFLIELGALRCTTCSAQHQTWILNSTRSVFLVAASIQILYSICTYRDYEMLNHDILLRLIEKMNGIERNKLLELEEDSDVEWSSWIDSDLPEDVGMLEDPDYIFAEQVGENSVQSTSSFNRYNLRNRHKYL